MQKEHKDLVCDLEGIPLVFVIFEDLFHWNSLSHGISRLMQLNHKCLNGREYLLVKLLITRIAHNAVNSQRCLCVNSELHDA